MDSKGDEGINSPLNSRSCPSLPNPTLENILFYYLQIPFIFMFRYLISLEFIFTRGMI